MTPPRRETASSATPRLATPRLEIRLDRIRHNAAVLVERLGRRGIAVTGVTKATLGAPEVARELLAAGVTSIGDSRVENLERMRDAGILAPMTLIRSPMPSQASRTVAVASTSLNSEIEVITALSDAAIDQGRVHGVILMVELGDLREGILPGDLRGVASATTRLPGVRLRGIGTNLACQSGVVPDSRNMAELSALAAALETSLGQPLDVVSGGNSANLDWALADSHGRVNDLRLGEAVLLGCEPLQRTPIEGLHTDACTLVAEVIEAKSKPVQPWGSIGQTAFGVAPERGADGTENPDGLESPDGTDGVTTRRVILGIGRQDVDPDGLGAPAGMTIVGASSDHLVLDVGAAPVAVGSEIRFSVNYSALLRSMTSPFVARDFRH